MQNPDLIYQSSKTYAHSSGFSCCFRQWRADSHCHLLHGYALKIELVWEGDLDERNWVQDFGGLKDVKRFLEGTFDHTLVIAEDDPELSLLMALHNAHIAQVVILPAVGCEKFAEHIMDHMDKFHHELWLDLKSVQVWEHEGNSAKVIRRDK